MYELRKQSSCNKMISENLLNELNLRFEATGLNQILVWGYLTFGFEMVLGTGFGPSGVLLIDRLHRLEIPVPVFYLDTNLLFDETYELRDRIEKRFDLEITRIDPALTLDEQAEKFGENLWEANPDRCCYLRKVLPLRNYLSDKRAWISGIRRSQSKSRQSTQLVEWDGSNEVIKLNPLANWTDEDVWEYIHDRGLSYNPLHDEGYPSIGCIPCTQPVDGNEDDERAGRWNGREKTECGIHLPTQEAEEN